MDQAVFETQVREAVNAIVQQQVSCGLDIISDGEMSKIGFSTYAKDRLSGFQDTDASLSTQSLPDLFDYPEYAQHVSAALPFAHMRFPSCIAPITYTGTEPLKRDLSRFPRLRLGVEAWTSAAA